VWGYGPFTNNALRSYGQVAEYTCLVSPGLCDAAPVACKTEITTGFTGDLNATYQNAGVGADGGADGGSAGVGGSEGKVLGGRIKVIRLADGVVLGEGVTDRQLGLTTIRWCKADMPVMLEMSGAPGAKYFDEAVNDLVDFPLTQKLRALVDRFDENVGVSALTEAAYMYAMNNIANDPAQIRAGIRPLVVDGVPVGISVEQIQGSAATVLREVNRRLLLGQELVTARTLATPVDKDSSPSAFPANRYGTIAALHGSIAKVSQAYSSETGTPALAAAKQFALDMTDGTADDYSLSGALVSLTPAAATYGAVNMSKNLAVGIGSLSARFGRTTTLPIGPDYIEGRMTSYLVAKDYYLSKVGTILEVDLTDINNIRYDREFLIDVYQMSERANGPVFAVTVGGGLYGWGGAECGSLGDGDGDFHIQDKPKFIPVPVPVRQVVSDQYWGTVIALAENGELYSWGSVADGLSGHSNAESLARPCRMAYSDKANLGIFHPIRMAGIPPIRFLRPGSESFLAVDFTGDIYIWGYSSAAANDPANFWFSTPKRIGGVKNIRDAVSYNPMKPDSLTRTYKVYAIDADRAVVGVFPFPTGPLPLEKAVQLSSDSRKVLALHDDGKVSLIAFDGKEYPVNTVWPVYRVENGFQATKVADAPPPFIRLQSSTVAGLLPEATAVGNDGELYIVDCKNNLPPKCTWVIRSVTQEPYPLPHPY
jgi:hypothetical protein